MHHHQQQQQQQQMAAAAAGVAAAPPTAVESPRPAAASKKERWCLPRFVFPLRFPIPSLRVRAWIRCSFRFSLRFFRFGWRIEVRSRLKTLLLVFFFSLTLTKFLMSLIFITTVDRDIYHDDLVGVG
jgi:hypothetical protein